MNSSSPIYLPERIVIGIDPGSTIMGYALLRLLQGRIDVLDVGVEKFKSSQDHLVRINRIFHATLGLIERYLPDEMAIEAPFYGKNVQAMLKLGRAQGAAISAALSRDIPVIEYAPKRVKQNVTGNGNATKEQVAYMVKATLGVDLDLPTLDASDALAIALCHLNSRTTPVQASRTWADFLAQNPDRQKR